MRQTTVARVFFIGLAAAACGPEGERSPALKTNPAWEEATISDLGAVRLVNNAAPKELLEPWPGKGPVTSTWLLFWGDQTAARDADGWHYVADTENHRVLMFDQRLGFRGGLSPQASEGRTLQRPQAVAAASDGRLAAFEAGGGVATFDRWGREFRHFDAPFAYAVGKWSPDGHLVLARSPFTLAFPFEPDDAPLLAVIDPAEPSAFEPVGKAREAMQAIYTHAANAGTVALDQDGFIYYAALGRPEVRKYSPRGEAVWISRRVVDFETPEPRLVPGSDGPPSLELATVQKAVTVGPDGRLYIRTAADIEGSHDRLDILDRVTGEWLRSAMLDTGTAVLAGPRGAIWSLEKDALVSDPASERREFRSFRLETFRGDTLALEDLRGRVALVAFWASWCAPCRDELPLLDSLRQALDRPDFAVLGINEDVNEQDARSFAEEMDLEMTLLLGRGRQRQVYHYSGLPYSVLLDRDGRVVREFYGFGGRKAFDEKVAARILAELGNAAPPTGKKPDEHRGHDHDHADHSEGPLPAMGHGHGPNREVSGAEMDVLAEYLPEAQALRPAAGPDVPDRHWDRVRDALALVDEQSTALMERFPGTFELVQLLSLKSQLYVDADRLPGLTDRQAFAEGWRSHLRTLQHLVETYEGLKSSDRR